MLHAGPSAGTQVTFPPTGSIVIGEFHVGTNFRQVHAGVSERGAQPSFIDELFPVDDLTDSPRLRRMVEAGLKPVMEELNLPRDADVRQFGADSIFPKLGWALTQILSGLGSGPPFAALENGASPESQYLGRMLPHVLMMAWDYANDVADRGSGPEAPGPHRAERAATEYELVRMVMAYREQIEPFVDLLRGEAFPSDSDVGSDLDSEEDSAAGGDEPVGRTDDRMPELSYFLTTYRENFVGEEDFDAVFLPALRTFVESLQAVLRGKVFDDAFLTQEQQENYYRSPDLGAMFWAWRDQAMSEIAADAVRRGVRYIGVGVQHMVTFRQRYGDQLPSAHFVDLAGPDRSRFETDSWHRWAATENVVPLPGAWGIADVAGALRVMPAFGAVPATVKQSVTPHWWNTWWENAPRGEVDFPGFGSGPQARDMAYRMAIQVVARATGDSPPAIGSAGRQAGHDRRLVRLRVEVVPVVAAILGNSGPETLATPGDRYGRAVELTRSLVRKLGLQAPFSPGASTSAPREPGAPSGPAPVVDADMGNSDDLARIAQAALAELTSTTLRDGRS